MVDEGIEEKDTSLPIKSLISLMGYEARDNSLKRIVR